MPRPEIVLGPPGTGKTTTVIDYVREELAIGTPPDRIGVITFTRRGAQEARDRMREQFGLGRSALPYFSTIHSLCARQLGLTSGSILDGARLQEFADLVGERVTGRFSVEDGSYSGYDRGDRMLFMDNLARVRGVSLRQQYEEAHDNIDWAVVERFARTLWQYKQDRHLVDYTDMLERFVAENRPPKLEVLVVDEAQDLSSLQWTVVRLLADDCRRFVVAGDDDQAIFRWAGADVDTLVDMEGDVRVLGQSWRVPRKIQSVAAGVVSRISHRREKIWRPRDEDGVVSFVRDMQDVSWEGPSVMVLARNQYLLTGIMGELRAAGVLFVHHGHPSVRQSYLDAIVTWERLRIGEPQPASSVVRAYELLESGSAVRRGGKNSLSKMGDQPMTMEILRRDHGLGTDKIWHEAMGRIPAEERAYMVRCRRKGERFSIEPRVRIDTIHASKGGQANRVVLLTDMAPRTYEESLRQPEDEARVWYVGCTRAKQELVVVAPRSRTNYQL